MSATHSQASAPLTDVQRARRKRGADLCRANPALWSQSVRIMDHLVASGMDRDQAHEQALAWAGV